jgi:hypothetical protein
VAGIEWYRFDDFKEMIKDPESHMLVPMGEFYFGMLVAALVYMISL